MAGSDAAGKDDNDVMAREGGRAVVFFEIGKFYDSDIVIDLPFFLGFFVIFVVGAIVPADLVVDFSDVEPGGETLAPVAEIRLADVFFVRGGLSEERIFDVVPSFF